MNEHPLLMDVGPIPGLVVLFVLFGVSGGFFAYQVTKATRLVLLGKPDDRFDSWPQRFKEVLTGWLGQKRVSRTKLLE